MKALILNSGIGSRMGDLTTTIPKCMIDLGNGETIIERQIEILARQGITEIVITTGPHKDLLEGYLTGYFSQINFKFVHNPLYSQTNYIYSILLAANELREDVVLLHGDLVFEEGVLEAILREKESSVVVCEKLPLPKKDFKAVIKGGKVQAIGTEFFDEALACQPLYKLNKEDWLKWLEQIKVYCEKGQVNCYAEKALNEQLDEIAIYPFYIGDALCREIDNIEDLNKIRAYLRGMK
ncbi:phosphocholine cytidylyltransferase family protein [Cellulosilyticum lentocellum]|uniref:Nucleotidyl transferase n=1 Tax=Cellulosilyticum lentocellum (strain ATCC 49066 / DSM 5427 / NCIMB 11756 / RHM5) TaxID=642492 RepID=F2JT42_CELLD|nr:phosphocholine cytidylyltransferase family protein [Cellulosilyticum lentocellum]ADZ85261.1 Nucleotidyl transferase [Cellulosilyticum lentocellum DSM 5427]